MLRALWIVLSLAACGGARPAPAPLVLADLVIYEGNEVVVHLLADGTVQLLEKGSQNGTRYEEWKSVARLDSGGKIVTADGKTARLTADGTLTTADGAGDGLHITSDALVASGWRMTIGARGAVLLDGKPFGKDKLVRVEGVTDANRRTALLLLALTVGRAAQLERGGAEY